MPLHEKLINPDCRALVIMPTYRQAAAVAYDLWHKLPAADGALYSRPDNQVTLKNGAFILFRGPDNPEQYAGMRFDYIGVAAGCGPEGSNLSSYILSFLYSRVREGGEFDCES